MSNVFDVFKPKEKEHFIKALNSKVVIRELTLGEQSEFTRSMIRGVDDKGQPDIDYDKALDVRFEKISKALVKPKMTTEELKGLNENAKAALDEIYAIIDPKGAEALEKALVESEGK